MLAAERNSDMKCRLVLALTTIALGLLGCNNGPKCDLNEDSSLDHVSQMPKLAP